MGDEFGTDFVAGTRVRGFRRMGGEFGTDFVTGTRVRGFRRMGGEFGTDFVTGTRVRGFRPMGDEFGTILAWAVRAQAGRGPHADVARQVVLAVLLAQLLAGAQHDGPPHAARRAPRHTRARRHRLPHRESLSGRRPRG